MKIHPGPSTKDFVAQVLGPLKWDDVFDWPPDLFAATASLLKRSGAYRYLISPPNQQQWPPAPFSSLDDWSDCVASLAGDWAAALDSDGAAVTLPTRLTELKQAVEARWDSVTLEDLADVDASPRFAEAWALCLAILELHAVADSAGEGFGTPMSRSEGPVVQFRADRLLAHSGSLSRVPRMTGRVLPKMRTPQTGLTLRSASLYLSWHETEVDAKWRTLPWTNAQENTVNVLVVPWPPSVDPFCFTPEAHPTGQAANGPNRYFTYAPRQSPNPNDVARAIMDCEPKASRVHLLVFPELAISWHDLNAIKQTLSRELTPDRIPLIVAGVRDWPHDVSDTADGSRSGECETKECNAVVMSAFFAGSWYDLKQDKHHRWKLDQKQVRQYNVGGVLASDRSWWEHVELRRRSLSIFAPTGWLALCPLICEDLAQMDPISEVIRGVGPTLLVALLLDGPQIPERWSARYASVLADDPGTSVLTVSPLGMVRRAIREGRSAADDGPGTRTVALWRDKVNGFRPLELGVGPDGTHDFGLLLTLSANWQEEFAADGRSDGVAASVFVLSGSHRIAQPARASSSTADAVGQSDASGKGWVDEWRRHVLDARDGDFLDITTFCQLVDSAIDADAEQLERLMIEAGGSELDGGGPTAPGVDEHRTHRAQPAAGRFAQNDVAFARLYLRCVLRDLGSKVPSVPRPSGVERLKRREWSETRLKRWEWLLDRAACEIDGRPESGATARAVSQDLGWTDSRTVRRRTEIAVLHTILWAIWNRLEFQRRGGYMSAKGADLRLKIQALLARELPPVFANANY